MAHDGKQGFFSSLFGNKKQKEYEETVELESKHRLEDRIQQILTEKVAVREPIIEEKHVAVITQEEEAEPEVRTAADLCERAQQPQSPCSGFLCDLEP